MQQAHRGCSYSDHLGLEAVCTFQEGHADRCLSHLSVLCFAGTHALDGKLPACLHACQNVKYIIGLRQQKIVDLHDDGFSGSDRHKF